ncbi:MAG: 3-oxoacid CoA-transferase subunit B [Alphaproteobacteria bacterium]|nr:3-oxoacid CoA-transferase subunit B [Alphaproteobacteria bacterium]
MKRVPVLTAAEAARRVRDGDVLLAGGFGMTGNPVHLLHALAETGTRGLTYVGNNVGEAGLGGGRLLRNGQLSRAIGSYLTSNREAVAAAQAGTLEVRLLPQGSLAEALRAGGAGLGGFYTPTGHGTAIHAGDDTRDIGGVPHVFVEAIRGDVAFIRAWKADAAGNLVYRRTEQNFNRAMATAARLVIAEVEEILPVGALDPDQIHTPGLYVDALVQAHTTLEELGSSASVAASRVEPSAKRLAMARRVLQELRPGDVVNLGIGIPTLVADLLRPEHGVTLHTENGMLGVGPAPESGGAMQHPVNAGKVPVTALPGASYFDSAESFGMIRGGHVDVAVMGGLQVDARGDLANWAVPGRPLLGVGGAMDLATGAGRLIVTMTHVSREGAPKLVPRCTLPLTARGKVQVVITDKAVFRVRGGALRLIELMPGATLEEVRALTTAPFVEALGE